MLVQILTACTQLLRPLLGIAGTCRYTVTCTAYVRLVFKEKPLHEAIRLSVQRVLGCIFFIRH